MSLARLDKTCQIAILIAELPQKEPFKVLSSLGAFYFYTLISPLNHSKKPICSRRPFLWCFCGM